jgi:hypothetical protein
MPVLEGNNNTAATDDLDDVVEKLCTHMATQLMKAAASLHATNAVKRSVDGGAASKTRHSTASRCVELSGSVRIHLSSHSVRYRGETHDTVHLWRDNGTNSPEPGGPRLCTRGSPGRVPRGYLRRSIQGRSRGDSKHRCHGFVEFCCVARGCRGTQRLFRRQPFQEIQTLAERECKDLDLAGVRTGTRAWRPHGVIRYQGWVPALSTGAENAQLVPIPLRGEVLPLCRPVDSVGLGDRRGCDECKELLESEQWLALWNSEYKARRGEDYILS